MLNKIFLLKSPYLKPTKYKSQKITKFKQIKSQNMFQLSSNEEKKMIDLVSFWQHLGLSQDERVEKIDYLELKINLIFPCNFSNM
jgi:hypothetical protein